MKNVNPARIDGQRDDLTRLKDGVLGAADC